MGVYQAPFFLDKILKTLYIRYSPQKKEVRNHTMKFIGINSCVVNAAPVSGSIVNAGKDFDTNSEHADLRF